MADNRSRLEKLIGMMESDNDNEALVALRMVKKIAAEEKKNLRELFLTGQTTQARPHPKPSENPNYRHGNHGFYGGFRRAYNDFEEAARRAEKEADEHRRRKREAAEELRRRQEADRQEARRQRYHGAFDDAEMTDTEREAARARRAAKAEERQNRKRQTADLLKDLQWAWDNGKDILNEFERVFVLDILDKYTDSSELSYNQEVVAKRIIKLVKADMADNPI